jgi:Ca-activated chloride channel family protein
MSRSLVLFLALIPGSAGSTPLAPMEGRVVFRPECFSHPEEEDARSRSSGSLGGIGGGRSAPASAAPMKQSSAPPPPAPMPMAAPEPSREMAMDEFDGDKAEGPAELRDGETKAKDDALRRDGRAYGSTVWLSNDDSMSLTSAQRVLYAVMNHLPVEVGQIRPHELLNYFSFDTRTPPVGETFDVLASAERHGDELSVALAVKGALPPRQPLDLTLVVDRSGSMSAEGRMDYTKRGLSLLGDQLLDGDRVDLVVFDHRVCVPLEGWVAGRDDRALLDRAIASLQPEGSTDLDLGLREGYRVANTHTDTYGRNRRMMLVTDALLNTGEVDPHTVSEVGKAYESDGIRLTGIGVGREFNDQVLDLLTEKGKGAYVFLGSEAVVDRVFGPSGFASLTQTVAHDVQFALTLPPSLALDRFYGEESSTEQADVQPIHYDAGTSQLFLQDLAIRGGTVVPTDAIELEIKYRDALTDEPHSRKFRTTVGKMLGTDPHNVRKGRALMAWTDMLLEGAMGGDACGTPLGVYAERAGRVSDDAEIAFVNGLVRGTCGDFLLPAVVTNEGVPFKVRVDSDIAIASVELACGTDHWSQAIAPADAIARFEDAEPGVCDLTLSGVVDMTARVEVPKTGGDMRCVVRGGRVACT